MQDHHWILSVNRGSSSLKFAVYRIEGNRLSELAISGKIDRLGKPDASVAIDDRQRNQRETSSLGKANQPTAPQLLIEWVDGRVGWERVRAVGHRIVHGGERFYQPTVVTPDVIAELNKMRAIDPDHLPGEIELVEAIAARLPELPQVVCFDTAFHFDMPTLARLLPIPRRFFERGVRRYGFHGLSYAFLLEELHRQVGAAANGRVVLAHLGAGASLAAVLGGRSVDTTMGFTSTAGLPMATRSGDLDPGLAWYLAKEEQVSSEQFHDLVNHQSGLLGISETSGDMRDLLAAEYTDSRAAEAVAYFCYAVKKWIGAYATALGGLDYLVFSGGIGEHLPTVRNRICQGLEFLGIHLDDEKNDTNGPVISAQQSNVSVHVIATNEELMIASSTHEVIGDGYH